MEQIEITFDYLDDTKNNYIFAQPDSNEAPQMFPKKIYLNKKLFSKAPQGVKAIFEPF